MDFTKVLTLDISAYDNTETNSGDQSRKLTMAILDQEQLNRVYDSTAYELNDTTIASIADEQVICFGAFIDEHLAGYIFFSGSPVDAKKNSGGHAFTGIALRFSDNVQYLYKAFVLPAYRGNKITQHIISYAAEYFLERGIDCIVTTTDWTNGAFLHAIGAVGFQSKGISGEYKLFGKHHYVLPKKISFNSESGDFISLEKPA